MPRRSKHPGDDTLQYPTTTNVGLYLPNPSLQPIFVPVSYITDRGNRVIPGKVANVLQKRLKNKNLPGYVEIKDKDIIDAQKQATPYVSLPGSYEMNVGSGGGSEQTGISLRVGRLEEFYKMPKVHKDESNDWDSERVSGGFPLTPEDKAAKEATGDKGDAMAGKYRNAVKRHIKQMQMSKGSHKPSEYPIDLYGPDKIVGYVQTKEMKNLENIPKDIAKAVIRATKDKATTDDIEKAIEIISDRYSLTIDEAKSVISGTFAL